MTNRERAQQAWDLLMQTTLSGRDWNQRHYTPPESRAKTSWAKAKDLLDGIDPHPAEDEIEAPTGLEIQGIGDPMESHTTHVEVGRALLVFGHGTPGLRVMVSSSRRGLIGGDAVHPDGTFRFPTVGVEAGPHEITAWQQTNDGTRKGPLSSPPVKVDVPTWTDDEVIRR